MKIKTFYFLELVRSQREITFYLYSFNYFISKYYEKIKLHYLYIE